MRNAEENFPFEKNSRSHGQLQKNNKNKKQNKNKKKRQNKLVGLFGKCLWIRYGQVYKAVFVYVPFLWIKVDKANLMIQWICRKRLSANKINIYAHSLHRKQLVHRNLPESGFSWSAYTNAGFSTKYFRR